jgi:hypothetical protein
MTQLKSVKKSFAQIHQIQKTQPDVADSLIKELEKQINESVDRSMNKYLALL